MLPKLADHTVNCFGLWASSDHLGPSSIDLNGAAILFPAVLLAHLCTAEQCILKRLVC